MLDRAQKALFGVLALPALARAAIRLYRLNRHHDLQELALRMADVRPWRLQFLSNPRYLDACIQRFAMRLPPRQLGPCLKRSFLLLDLWSRCGLEPRIHMGSATSSDGRHSFHAWVTCTAGEHHFEDSASKYHEIWSHPGLDRCRQSSQELS